MKNRITLKKWICFTGICILIELFAGCSGLPGEKVGQSIMTESQDNLAEWATQSVRDKEIATEEKIVTIFVHVCGCVKSPGLYEFTEGIRAGNAIETAGGFTKEADKSAVNLAEILKDGVQLYVPSQEESITRAKESKDTGTEGKKVNINSASAEEFMTLSGIGESRADAILSFREENGSFSSIEDIKNVPGIGEGIFERIKDLITV